ncbi:hypothetical protein SDC9_168107 [bioreactor metagenome]|uniref:Uncharacterized protein n=1 Tax=bioreactor metagenome TaxID=1076179 RepID=A0A645G1M2_9ZZZZ
MLSVAATFSTGEAGFVISNTLNAPKPFVGNTTKGVPNTLKYAEPPKAYAVVPMSVFVNVPSDIFKFTIAGILL